MTLRTSVLVQAMLVVFAGQSQLAVAQGPVGNTPDAFGRGPSQPTASVKLEVTPRQTQVFINGYYAGIADDFDGAFQQLRIEAGEHDIQLFLPGYRLYTEHVSLQPEASVKLRHVMERLAAGETEPQRPTAAPRPPRVGPGRPGAAPPPAVTGRGRGQQPDANAAREGYGSISVRIQPADAQVMVDGTRWDAPAGEPLLLQLAAGPHMIEVRKTGYRVYLTEVTVRGGETVPLNVSLSKEP